MSAGAFANISMLARGGRPGGLKISNERDADMDVVRQIKGFNEGRDPERLQMKYRKMRADAFAFMRGTCHLFYARLPTHGIFASAPLAWVCGDLHVENFGSYKGDNRLVYFDLNDFDEAALAPVTWELVRFLTSLRVATGSFPMSDLEADDSCVAFVDAYAGALANGKAFWVERETAIGLVRNLLNRLRDRKRLEFLDSYTHLRGKRRILRIDEGKALAVSDTQDAMIRDFMAGYAQAQPDPGFYRVLNVARRVAGTGSLGVDRYIVLVAGKGSPDRNYLLDLKLSLPSSLAPYLKTPQPKWNSEPDRIVTVQRRLQAVSMAFLEPVSLGQRGFVIRGLQPSEDRVSLARAMSRVQRTQLVTTMGSVVAWAQLRSAGRQNSALADELIDFGKRKKWQLKLLQASLDCAKQLRRDSAKFDAAYDDGAFGG